MTAGSQGRAPGHAGADDPEDARNPRPQHGYGIARRIEQVSGDLLAVNQGTLYPALVRLEQEGWIQTEWGQSENNRRAKFYSLTRLGRRQLVAEEKRWTRASAIMSRFLDPLPKARP